MKNYYIVKSKSNNYLCVDVKHCLETRWIKNLPDLFPTNFCDLTQRYTDSVKRFYNHSIIAEFDELPSSYEEFAQLYPEFCI